MTPTATATTTHTVNIAPRLRRKWLQELKAYAELKSNLKVIEHAMEGHKTTISALLEESGETAVELDGFKVTHVTPTRTTLSKEKLLLAGVTMAQIEAATETKAVKAFDKISCPGEVEKEYSRG
jgi:hypothetical protein